MSNDLRNERERFREKAAEEQAAQAEQNLKRRIEFINQSYEKMRGMRTKEAWRSFIFLRGEVKKFIRAWEDQIKNVDTPENKRLYYLGCQYGAMLLFQIAQNFVDIKKDLDKGKFDKIKQFFKIKQ